MRQAVIDFETYYDAQFSLSRMPTDEYIEDPRFEVIGVSVKIDDGPIEWFSGDEFGTAAFLASLGPWEHTAILCHNTLFDGYILTRKFGIKPKLWMDALGMSRRLYPWLASHSLASLAKHFDLPAKGTVVHNMMGRTRASLFPQELADYAEYCKHDVELTYEIGQRMLSHTPVLELKIIDMVARMFTEPAFVGDAQLLRELHQRELDTKAQLIEAAEADRADLMSNDKFAAKLEELGIEPPTKISPRTGKVAYAFAKSDKEFTALLDDDDPRVQSLVAARLGVKTTIAETRALRFLAMAERGLMPVYLNYCGAKVTQRLSGGNRSNWQNLSARGPSAGIRQAICAPPGHVVIAGDSSNIELRVAMAAAGQQDVVDKLAAGEDLYCDFASKIFGRSITKADKMERLLGKIGMLSLQYGAGWPKFKEMARIQSQGAIQLADDEAERVVSLYRHLHYKVMDFARKFDNGLFSDMAEGGNMTPVDEWAWCLTTGNGFGVGGDVGVQYKDLDYGTTDRYGKPELGWSYWNGRKRVPIYGGKAVENFSQYVARMIVMWQTARINEVYPVKLSVHDEAVGVVPDNEAEEAKAYFEECLSLAPPWCRGMIPLACEVSYGKTYADCK